MCQRRLKPRATSHEPDDARPRLGLPLAQSYVIGHRSNHSPNLEVSYLITLYHQAANMAQQNGDADGASHAADFAQVIRPRL
jgi:hypothetical protein